MLSHLVQERIILENALDSLKAFLHIEMMWTQDSGLDKGLDGFLTIKTQTFPIEVKNEFKMNQLPRLDIQKQQHPNLILIANVLPEKIKSILRENKINYLDTAGNSYISSSDGLIFVDGQKPVAKPEINKDKAFTKKGLVIVFHLLNDETLLNATYRKIAETTQTSLDTVTKVFQSLRQQGFIQSIDTQTMRLIEKKRLFEKWADAYENKLKPHLFIGNFRFQNAEAEKNWTDLNLSSSSFWGGEPAASLLTDAFLRPAVFTFYSTETKTELIKNYRFLPDPNGQIKVYLPFTHNQNSPLLVYADMLNSGIARNFEVAEKIYNQYVKNIF